MKTLLTAVFAALFGFSAAALRPGDLVAEPISKVKWLKCSPFKLGPYNEAELKNAVPFRALVFMFTRANGSDRMIRMLEDLRLRFRSKLLIAAVTPDTEYDALVFQQRHKDVRVRMLLDSERRLTPLFMNGSILYPMAFLYGADGRIIWCGEAVDLAEAVNNAVAGKLDYRDQRKISGFLDDMQQRMRTGEFRPLKQSAEKIFKLDPANSSALRMLLFSLENSNRNAEAWELISERIKASPSSLKLYYTAIDFMRRHPEYRRELTSVAAAFEKSAGAPGEFLAFAETLLLNFPEEAVAIEIAHAVIFGRAASFGTLDGVQKAHYCSIKARLSHLLGDLAGAVSCQAEAVKLYQESRHENGSSAAAARLEFYRRLLKTAAKKFETKQTNYIIKR